MVRHIPHLSLTELRRYSRIYWSYKLDALSWIALWALAFPLLMVTFDNVAGGYESTGRQASLLGFLLWDWSMGVLAAAAVLISTEAREGTLENVALAPVSFLTTVSLRIVVATAILGVQTLVLGIILALVLRVPLGINGPAIAVVALTLVGAGGLSLVMGGLALRFKSVESLVNVFTLLALVLTGALIPLNQLGVLFDILKLVMPAAWGIEALRQVTIGGATWATLAADGTWAGLAVQAIVFILVGVIVFHRNFSRAQADGSLAAY